MGAHTWNIVGLVLVSVGVIVLFAFGMPYRVLRGGASFLILEQRNAADLKQERLFDVLGWIGLSLVIVGTIRQIVANTSWAS